MLNSIKELATSISFKAGDTIFNEGDQCQNFLIVEKGKIRVFKTSEKGQTLTLYEVDSDNLCTLTTSCILSTSHYPAQGIAEKDVKGLLLNKESFDKLLLELPEFKNLIFSSLSQRFTGLVSKIDEIAFLNLKERIELFLNKKAKNTKQVAITHQKLAEELGVERESISRALKTLETTNQIQLSRGVIKILS